MFLVPLYDFLVSSLLVISLSFVQTEIIPNVKAEYSNPSAAYVVVYWWVIPTLVVLTLFRRLIMRFQPSKPTTTTRVGEPHHPVLAPTREAERRVFFFLLCLGVVAGGLGESGIRALTELGLPDALGRVVYIAIILLLILAIRYVLVQRLTRRCSTETHNHLKKQISESASEDKLMRFHEATRDLLDDQITRLQRDMDEETERSHMNRRWHKKRLKTALPKMRRWMDEIQDSWPESYRNPHCAEYGIARKGWERGVRRAYKFLGQWWKSPRLTIPGSARELRDIIEDMRSERGRTFREEEV